MWKTRASFDRSSRPSMAARLGRMLTLFCGTIAIAGILFTPARADYWDDVKAKASQCGEAVKDQGGLLIDVVGTGPRIAACATTLAGSNAAGIAITGLVAGLYLTGSFDTEEQCQGLLVSAIAKQLGLLVKSSSSVQSAIHSLVTFLGGTDKDADDAINTFLDLAADKAVDVMHDIEGAEVLFGYFGCACTVIGGSADLQKQMDKANDSTNECLGPVGEVLQFFEDLHGAVLDFIISLIPDVPLTATPNLGDHYNIDPNAGDCALGPPWQSGLWPYTKAYAEVMKGQLVLPDNGSAIFKEYGMCTCPSGTLPKTELNADKTALNASCECPEGEKFDANYQCISQCDYGSKYDYKHDHQCEPICKYGVYSGYYTDPNGKKHDVCTLSCDDPKAVFDVTKGKCEVCGPNEKTIHTGYDDGGRCEYCGSDGKLTADNKCEAICSHSWTEHKVNFLGKDVCENICPRGQKWTEVNKQGDGGFNTYKCEECGQGTQLDPNTNTCTPCAQGANWIAASTNFGAQCQCPTGLAPVNGVCEQCPGGVTPSSDGNGNLVCSTCPDGSDCLKDERIACYFKNGIFNTADRTCNKCADNEHPEGGQCVKDKHKVTKVKNPLADKPCDGANEVRDQQTFECVSCGDKMRAVGNRCWPLPQIAGTPKAPDILAQKCGENEVRDPYTMRCTTCGEAGFAFNSVCLPTEKALHVPTEKLVPKAKLVSLDPAQKSCPAGTYPLGNKYCQQDILPSGQTAAGRCSPKGANMVFDGRSDGGCTPCGTGTKPNAGRTECVQTALLTPSRPADGKAAKSKGNENPSIKGASVKPEAKPEIKGTAIKPKNQDVKGTALVPKQKSIAPDLDSDGPSIGSKPGTGTPAIPSGGNFGGAAPGGNRKP